MRDFVFVFYDTAYTLRFKETGCIRESDSQNILRTCSLLMTALQILVR